MAFTNTPLYGGAITVDIPSGYADVSQIRQVPDHQEIYLDSAGYANIVFEILEYVDKPSDAEALQYHFADLVDGTGDKTNVIDSGTAEMLNLPTCPLLTLTTIQTPVPSPDHPRRKSPEFVFIHLLLLRLKDKKTDIMVTINSPHFRGEYEEPSERGGETRLMRESTEVREKVLESFRIVDWGLFDG